MKTKPAPISVSLDCIKRGERGSAKACPVALGVKNELIERGLNEVYDVCVSSIRIELYLQVSFTGYRKYYCWYLPSHVVQFVYDIDSGMRHVMPVVFALKDFPIKLD